MVLTIDEKIFTKEVLEAPIPVLVNFGAPWCSLCRVIHPLLLNIHSEWGDQIKLVNINADENFKLSTTYRLTSLPTILLFKDGKLQHRFDEFRSRDDLHAVASIIQTKLETMTVAYSYTA